MGKTIALMAGAVMVLLAGCSETKGGGDESAKAKADFERACTSCHFADVALSKVKTKDEWKATVQRMRVKGAALSHDEGERVALWLHSQRPQ